SADDAGNVTLSTILGTQTDTVIIDTNTDEGSMTLGDGLITDITGLDYMSYAGGSVIEDEGSQYAAGDSVLINSYIGGVSDSEQLNAISNGELLDDEIDFAGDTIATTINNGSTDGLDRKYTLNDSGVLTIQHGDDFMVIQNFTNGDFDVTINPAQ